MIEFKPWAKTPRYYRDITVTEKIDGTNGAIQIVSIADEDAIDGLQSQHYFQTGDGEEFLIAAQSRNRVLTPGSDNAGFSKWVQRNWRTLLTDLGPGVHFGEWWGQGVQRGYGLTEKRFSLFNTSKWSEREFETTGLGSVPVLYQGPHEQIEIDAALHDLVENGSVAAPGYDRPEGVIVYHHAANNVFKVLIENDEISKSQAKQNVVELRPKQSLWQAVFGKRAA